MTIDAHLAKELFGDDPLPGKKPKVVLLSSCCGVPAIFESDAEGYSCPKCGSSDSDE